MKTVGLLAIILYLLYFGLAYAVDLKITWDANTESDLGGYNLSYDTFNLRIIGSAIFSREVPLGLTTYFEWSEGISHDNLYFFAGPAWMF